MFVYLFFCKQKTAYEMRISDWSSDVCSSDLSGGRERPQGRCHPFKQPSSKERTLPLNANNQGSTSERTSFVKRLNKVSRMAEKAKLSRAAVEIGRAHV